MKLRYFMAVLFSSPLVCGCVFGGGGTVNSTTDTGTTTPDVATDASGVDMRGDPRDVGAADMMIPSDADDADSAVDMGPPVFTFERTERLEVLMPVWSVKLANQDWDPETLVTKRHLEAGWSANFEWVDAIEPLPAAEEISFAFLATESVHENTSGEPIDIDPAPHWENPSGIASITASTSLMNNVGLSNGDNYQTLNPELEVDMADGEMSMSLPEGSFRAYFDDGFGIGSRRDLEGEVKAAVSHDHVIDANITARVASVAYAEVGDQLEPVNNVARSARGRRVILGPDEAAVYNRWGWMIFDNVVSWVLYEPFAAEPEYTCVLVTEPALAGGERDLSDHHIITRMRRAGCNVVLPSGGDSMPNVVDLVVISPTASEDTVSPFAARAAPTLVLFDEATVQVRAMQMASGAAPPTNGSAWSFSPDVNAGLRANYADTLALFPTEYPLAAVLSDKRAPGAVVVATVDGSDAATHFYVGAGEALSDGEAAPADRVALGLSTLVWDEGLIDVFDLFDSSVEWLLWRSR